MLSSIKITRSPQFLLNKLDLVNTMTIRLNINNMIFIEFIFKNFFSF